MNDGPYVAQVIPSDGTEPSWAVIFKGKAYDFGGDNVNGKSYADLACAHFKEFGQSPGYSPAPGYTLYDDPDAG